jgi:hypothetical protein
MNLAAARGRSQAFRSFCQSLGADQGLKELGGANLFDKTMEYGKFKSPTRKDRRVGHPGSFQSFTSGPPARFPGSTQG